MGRKRTIANVAAEASVSANDVLQSNPERPSKRTRGRQNANLPTSSAAVLPSVTVTTPPTRRSARIKVPQSSTSAYINTFGNDDSELSDEDTPTTASAALTDPPMSDSEEEEAAKQKKATPKKKAAPKKKKAPVSQTPKRKAKQDIEADVEPAADASEGEATREKKAKTPRKRKPKITEPIVYDIPDVEKKTTTFK
ncbi:hypothetical protein FS837_008546, partial [Tulasnella sp. UAMH 9824]